MLMNNHGRFGDDSWYIWAEIEPESEKIKNLVFFKTPFLGFLGFFAPLSKIRLQISLGLGKA